MLQPSHLRRIGVIFIILIGALASGIIILQETNSDVLSIVPTRAILPSTTADDSEIVLSTAVPEGIAVTEAAAVAAETEAALADVKNADDAPLRHTESVVEVSQNADNIETIETVETVEDRVLIQFDTETSQQEREQYLAAINAQVTQEIPELNTLIVTIEGLSQRPSLPASPIISSSEPDYLVRAAYGAPTNDPLFDNQWSLPATGITTAWESLPADATPIVVAVLDSGVCLDHPDLQGRFVNAWDYVDDDAIPQDTFGHGCGVSGIIAANIDNEVGIAGIAPHVQIMPLRVLDHNGIGTYSDVAQAIVRAVDEGAQFINLSLGGTQVSNVLADAVRYAVERDVMLIAAAGNTADGSLLLPAAYPAVIAVGSVDESLVISEFSSTSDSIDAWAPGENIITTANNHDYELVSGTSFATPHVTGIAAIERAHGRQLVADGGLVLLVPDDATTDQPTSPNLSDVIVETDRQGNLVLLELPPLTDEWLIRVVPGTDPEALATQLGFENLGRVGQLADAFVFRRANTDTSSQVADTAANALRVSPQVVFFIQQREYRGTTRAIPSEPLLSSQWHLNNTGQSGGTLGADINVFPVWQNTSFDGTGVVVGIVDSGLQHAHPDIAPNYLASASFDFNDGDPDPSPTASNQGHGTSVAGLTGAADDGSCGLGVAYNAQLSGIRLISDLFTVSTAASALSFASGTNDIYNNSWGPVDDGVTLWTEPEYTPVLDVFADRVANGRGGLGNIYVWAAGNGRGPNAFDHMGRDILASSRYTIAVGAIDDSGEQSFFSEEGSALMVVVPGSTLPGDIVTTDLLGASGFAPGDCNQGFTGTSAATPIVAGIVALMLDANPNLTWRDVQHILVDTAIKVDPTDPDWRVNGAGHDVNIGLGFGLVDAEAAVNAAVTWTPVPPQQTVTLPTQVGFATIPDGSGISSPIFGAPLVRTIHVPDEIFIEHVEVIFDATHSLRGDLDIRLISPAGTESILSFVSNDFGNHYTDYRFTSVQQWDEVATGTWTLEVRDGFAGSVGALNAWQLILHGTSLPPPANDNFADAEPVSNLPLTKQVVTSGATVEVGEPASTCEAGLGHTIWYSYDASVIGGVEDLRVVTSAGFDTSISIWKGNQVNSLTEIVGGCDSDTIDDDAEVQITLTEDITYFIRVASENGDVGGVLDVYFSSQLVPTTNVIVVNDTGDLDTSATCAGGGLCTLRGAIEHVNNSAFATPPTIVFKIPGISSHRFQPRTALTIEQALILDATTQPGYVGQPIIEIDGSQNNLFPTGALRILNLADDSALVVTVRGFVVNNFPNSTGISASHGHNHVIENNYVGTDLTGTLALPNDTGVLVAAAGTILQDNLISGNANSGLIVRAADVQILGNIIGTDINVTNAMPNRDGISLEQDANNVLIGAMTNVNYISGNTHAGLLIGADAENNLVISNIIGGNMGGTQAIGNGNEGILIKGHHNIIGQAGKGNVISGNNTHGVRITGNGNVFVGNHIGLNAAATAAIPNQADGVYITGDNNIFDVTADPDSSNIIAGNVRTGIVIESGADGNQFYGVYIGINDLPGPTEFPNGKYGIFFDELGGITTIGSTNPAEGNYIIGNSEEGIFVENDGNSIIGNIIGNNNGDGVLLLGDNNLLQSNRIGIDESENPMPNGENGVHVLNGSNNAIGDTGAGNTIASNTADGIFVESGDGNTISGNHIFNNDDLGIDLGANGVTANDADDSDTGANGLQNFPIFTGGIFNVSEVTMEGELAGSPNTAYRAEFFTTASCDPSGYGEGEDFFGAVEFSLDGSGFGTFSEPIAATIDPSHHVVMTATNLTTGATSEFSKCSLIPPNNLNTQTISQVQIDLAWDITDPDADTTHIEMKETGETTWNDIAIVPVPEASFGVTELFCDTSYDFRFASHSNDGNVSLYMTAQSVITDACPPNDELNNGIALTSLPESQQAQTFGASPGTDPIPSCAMDANRTVWYTLTPSTSGAFWFFTDGSDFDTVLAIYTGSPGSLTEMACDNNGSSGNLSFLQASLSSGITYSIAVAGDENSGGNAVLTAQEALLPTPTAIPTHTPMPTATSTPNENTVGLYQNGLWAFRDANSTGSADVIFTFGSSEVGWQPVVGDWDGDGVDGIGLYKDGLWLLRQSSTGGTVEALANFGNGETGWQPVVGDWDGDGFDGIGLYKDGLWLLRQSATSGNVDVSLQFNPLDGQGIPVAGDWHNRARDVVGLYYNGTWYLLNDNASHSAANTFNYGPADGTWLPVVGDWNADGRDTIGVFQNGIWRLRNSNNGGTSDIGFTFNGTNGIPVANYRGGLAALKALAVAPDTSGPSERPMDDAPPATALPEQAQPEETATVNSTASPTSTFIPMSTTSFTPTATSTPEAMTSPVPESEAETTQEP